ncbi:MAG: VCBS domain-containing protein [Pseudomonadota bacterium]
MNYAGKFGSGSPDIFSSAGLKIDALGHQGGGDSVTIPDAHLLFSGDYSRSGADLIVSDQLHRVVVPNYFHGDKRPALLSPDGAPLDPKVIEALTGHVEYAQAASSAAAAATKVVGHVVKMTGSASVVRNGVTITLNNGDNVLQNDVVQTGSNSSVGLVMIDGTTFNLSAGARLMLNDLTYDAASTSNSSLFTLVQGAASFVAGQVAKTGDMKVGTPIATMGIRGTAVILDISATDGKVSISVIDQRDGQVHAVQVYNTRGVLIGTVTSNGGGLTLTPVTTFEVIAQESNKTPAQVATEFTYLDALLQTYKTGKDLFPDLPQHTENLNAYPKTPGGAPGSSPSDSPYTIRHAFNDPGAPVASPQTQPAGQPEVPPPAPGGAAPPPEVVPPVVVVADAKPLPFVVNPTTVPQISSAPGDHFGPVMSASGDVVYDPDGIIFFHDRETGTTIRVTPAGDGFSYSSQTISADGRYLAYQGTNGTDTFVFIYATDPSDPHYHQQLQLVAGTSPALSGDGSTILVEHGGDSIGIYDLQGHVLGTITAAGIGASGTVWKPAISADGHVIAFWNCDDATPGGAGHLFTYDRTTGVVTEIASTADGAGLSAASFSADGRYVVYQSEAPDGHSEIYLYDLAAGQVVFHTANAAGASYNPVLSADGHYIVFASDAALTPGDGNAFADTYMVDVTDPNNPLYSLVSVRPDGTSGDADSNRGATVSAGGKYVAFGSNASNLLGLSGDPDGGEGDIFISDPTSGRSAIIYQNAASPSVLHAGGVIDLTGASSAGVTIRVTDQFGNPTSLFTAGFNAAGDLQWSFDEARADFAALPYGQDVSRQFLITMTSGDTSTTTPVTVTIHNGIQPVITVANTAPTIQHAAIAASEGQAVVLTAADIGVSDFNDTDFTFKVTDVAHGMFQVLVGGAWQNTFTFTSAELAAGQIRFLHDGGEAAPTFSIQADDGDSVNHRSNVLTGSVGFTNVNDAPAIDAASLVVSEGGTVVLDWSVFTQTHASTLTDFSIYPTRADLPAFASSGSFTMVAAVFPYIVPRSVIEVNDPDSSSFVFTVSNVTHGRFQTTTDGVNWADAGSFTSADLAAGHVRFVHDGSEFAPTFSIQADDGAALDHLSNVFAGNVHFINVNDVAAITGTAAGAVVEDSATTAGGSLVVQDADSGEAVFAAVPAAALAGSYGNFTFDAATGAWTYALVHGQADSLAEGQVVHDTLTVTSADGTASQLIDVTVTGANDAPAILGATNPATQVVIVAGPGTPVVLAQGISNNSVGLNTETFDGRQAGSASNNGAGYGGFFSATLGATFSGSGNAGVVNGASSGVTAPPFIGPLPGGVDTTNYLSIGGGSTETITFIADQNAFGLYWGSVDSYNAIAFYHGTTLVASYSGANVTPLFADGNQGSFSSNGYVQFLGLGSFDRVVLSSSSNAFEIDNISAGSVHAQLAAPISGTIAVSDADIGDTLTASVVGNGVVQYNGSSALPANLSALTAASAVTFDSVQSDGGTQLLHWSYDPGNPNLDFLKPGDTLTITFIAQVNDGHGNVGSQPLTVTIKGAETSANPPAGQVVSGTTANDVFGDVDGNTTVYGGGGHDTFRFNAAFGSATIGDFEVNNDRIEISHTSFASVEAIMASARSANSGHDTVITDAAHNTITFIGVTVDQIRAHSGDFHLI